VILVFRFAQLDRNERGRGEARLEGEYLLGRLVRVDGLLAGEFEHLGDVGLVSLAQFGVVGLGVVLRGRQADAALRDIGDLHLRILEVRCGVDAEQAALAAREAFGT